MEHADLEAVAQERPITSGPLAVLGSRPLQLGDIVPPVVVDGQESATGAEEPGGLGHVGRSGSAERRPEPDDDIRGRVGRIERAGPRIHDRDAGAECSKLTSAQSRGSIDDDDVSPHHRT